MDFQHNTKMINLKEIKKSIYFKNLDEQDFNALLRCIRARAREYPLGDEIVSAGDSTKDIYLVISGFAREIKNSADGDLVIGLDYKKNQIYGLEYITSKDKVYKDSLIALSDCVILIVDRFRFLNPCDSYCRRHIELNSLTMLELARIGNNYKTRVNVASKGKTRNKVLEYLSSLAKENKSKEFYIPYSREELAKILGVERTALSAELSSMKKDGLIEFNHNYFKIIDL